MIAVAVLACVVLYVAAGRLLWRLFAERRSRRAQAARALFYFEAQVAARERLEAERDRLREQDVARRVARALDRHSPGARLERRARLRLIRGGKAEPCD